MTSCLLCYTPFRKELTLGDFARISFLSDNTPFHKRGKYNFVRVTSLDSV